jgi:hypothetical protein
MPGGESVWVQAAFSFGGRGSMNVLEQGLGTRDVSLLFAQWLERPGA